MGGSYKGPYNKDHSILGSILGSSCVGKLPYPANPSTTATRQSSPLQGADRRSAFASTAVKYEGAGEAGGQQQ